MEKKKCMKSEFLTDMNIKTMNFWHTTSNNFSILVPTFRRNLLLPSSMYTDNYEFYFNGKRRENNTMKTLKWMINVVSCNEWVTYVIMRGFHRMMLRLPGGISSRPAQHSSRESASLQGGNKIYSCLLLAWNLLVVAKTCWPALAYVAISRSGDILVCLK